MKKNKIGILTLPLHTNYGGLLQAYALQQILYRMGHEAWVLDVRKYDYCWLYRKLSRIKTFLRLLISRIGHKSISEIFREYRKSGKVTLDFVQTHIYPISPCLSSTKQLKSFVEINKFDAFVVGSDQVWRLRYCPNIYNYFLAFVESNQFVKKISYAASFGTDDWNFSEEETRRCKELLSLFDAVSVREKGGVDLCRHYLGRTDVQWTLDPTMLLCREDYEQIIKEAHLPAVKQKHIVSYILDENPSKNVILSDVQSALGLPVYNANEGLSECSQLHLHGKASVEEWLFGFQNAEYAVVDSFHGCVFSIIFHVPFIVIGNQERGMSRFYSLLSLFGLEGRMVETCTNVVPIVHSSIDWKKIDDVLSEQRKQSSQFLTNYTK